MFLKIIPWEVSRSDLLGNTTGFTGLNVGTTKLVQNEGLTSVDVTQDANNWAAKLLLKFNTSSLASCESLLPLSKQLPLAFPSILSVLVISHIERR